MRIKVFINNNNQLKDLENILDKFIGEPMIDTPITGSADKNMNYVTVHAKEERDIILLSEYLVGRRI